MAGGLECSKPDLFVLRMCGICGVYSRNGNVKKGDLSPAIAAMNKIQENRGPDAEGFSFSPGSSTSAAFGHRRLAIIDLSPAGRQPMRRQKKKGGFLEIVFNGEIYNFRELRDELRSRGFEFSTETDTEIILAAFECWGEDSFARLRGMFSFALWDSVGEILFLVRDRFGIKPLYWAEQRGNLVFASTVRAVAQSGLINLSKNRDAWLGFLLFGSVPLPLTTWREIEALPAGCFMKIRGGERKISRYYSALPFFADFSAENNSSDMVSVLGEAVACHLISDAPLGVFLSGGVDSSVLAVLAAEGRKDPLKTVSVTFGEEKFSEEKYQKAVAKKIGSDHRSLELSKDEFLTGLPGAWQAMDQPTIDGLNVYFVAAAAKAAGLKAVLSGLGSDEIFLGYPNFRRAEWLKSLSRLPGISRMSFLGGKYGKFAFLKAGGLLGFYLVFRGIFSPAKAAQILGLPEKEIFIFIADLEERLFGSERTILEKMDPIQLLSYLELNLYIQNQLLKDSDFMAMAHSVEIRVPFLDHILVEKTARLAPAVKLAGPFNKQVLIDAAGPVLPPIVYQRPKMGFTFPFEEWLAGEKRQTGHWSRRWALEVMENFKT